MPTHRQLVGRITVGLLLIVVAAACSRFGPDLHIAIDNTDGPKEVTVTVDSSGPGMTGGEDVNVPPRQGAEWSVPLGSTWEVKVDGKHVIGSGDRTDLALPSPGQRQDLMIRIQVAADGTVMLLDAH
jgi:hypothetical protein